MIQIYRRLFAAFALLSAGGLVVAAPPPALAASPTFVQHQSRHDFAGTLSALKHSISRNGMMVMGQVNQAKGLSMTGLNLAGAQSFLVGNPIVGKKFFTMNPAVGAALPLRVYVWQAAGHTHVGYFEPSDLLGGIDPMLAKPGQMMDQKFAAILKDATE